jgi:formiminotetrahydrofolate cyclodeaminase
VLTTLSINEYAAKLASSEPAPGGGSAAALSGLLGVSLIEMVINLTVGKEKFASYEEQLTKSKAELARLHVELQLLVDRDAEAYNALMEAYRLPKQTEEEKQTRGAFIQQAVLQAAEIPLWTARTCLEVIEIGKSLLGKVNPHAVSDLMIGALSSHTGVISALLNTAINLPLLKDAEQANALAGEIHLLRTTADEQLAIIRDGVYNESIFHVMKEI